MISSRRQTCYDRKEGWCISSLSMTPSQRSIILNAKVSQTRGCPSDLASKLAHRSRRAVFHAIKLPLEIVSNGGRDSLSYLIDWPRVICILSFQPTHSLETTRFAVCLPNDLCISLGRSLLSLSLASKIIKTALDCISLGTLKITRSCTNSINSCIADCTAAKRSLFHVTTQYLDVRARTLYKTILALRGSAAPHADILGSPYRRCRRHFPIIGQPSNSVFVCTSFVSIATVSLR